MCDEQLREALRTEFQSSGSDSESGRRRRHNIEWIRNLPRTGLSANLRERQLLIATTQAGECLYIQFPGRESQRVGANIYPYDFFPVIIKQNGTRGQDLGFTDIFNGFQDSLTQPKFIRLLAVLFYRMAFMVDHSLSDNHPRLRSRLIDQSQDDINIHEEGEIEVEPFYKYTPDRNILNWISNRIPKICHMSLEGFLWYCELLAWNEDSKYFYKTVERGNKNWIGATGRVNTLLTVVRVLGYILGDVRLGDLIGRFQYGVSPATPEEIKVITNNIVFHRQSLFS